MIIVVFKRNRSIHPIIFSSKHLHPTAKKNPRQDFAHLHYDNATPLVEGEKPALMRAGSDSFLNEHNGVPDPFMEVRHMCAFCVCVCLTYSGASLI